MKTVTGPSAPSDLQEVDNSQALDRGIRVGLVVYGVVHLIIAGIAIQMVFGNAGGKAASQKGAFAELAGNGLGRAVLFLMAAGFAALVIWQLVEAAVGHREHEGAKRVVRRLSSAGRAVVYGVFAYGAASTAASGGGSQKSSTDSLTAQVMSAPAGQVLVVLVGVGIVAVGVGLAYQGVRDKFLERLDSGALIGDRRKAIAWSGRAGYVGKGASLVGVGLLFVVAGFQHQAKKSGGLDVALHHLLRQPFGAVLVAAVALGLAAFGLFCFAWARHLRH